MEIIVNETIRRIITVTLDDRIDAFNAPELRERFMTFVADGCSDFVLDLSAVPFIDSAGLSVLVSLLKRTRQSGGDVKLVWPQDEAAKRIFHLTKFDRVFEMYHTADAARQAF